PTPPAVVIGEFGVPVLADARYHTVDSLTALAALLERIREVPRIALDTATISDPNAPSPEDPLRSVLVGLSIAVAPGEAYYLPLRHRADEGGNLGLLSGDAGIAGKLLQAGAAPPVNLPPLESNEMAPL